MSAQPSIAERRARLLERLFPKGVPRLWCPPLTHYDNSGALDRHRIVAHLRHLSKHVRGFLIPGSTGDGWELTSEEVLQLLEVTLPEIKTSGGHVLIGALETDAEETFKAVHQIAAWLKSRADEPPVAPRPSPLAPSPSASLPTPVCGFTICAPRGKDVSQEVMGRALADVLQTGLPIALYQLPQMTQNEFSGELASNLASRFDNFIFFKDSSGADQVILSGKDLEGVFTTRGGEGDYVRWPKLAGGPYEGFLLGSANCFAAELRQMIEDISAARWDAARKMSARLTGVVKEVSRLVAQVSSGNAFANANKAIDHFFAHGPKAAFIPPPRLHSGSRLQSELISTTGEMLARYELMPTRGYLE
ncbi:MAG TPA: dihydrodipicolinate synthase family protein [Candidatus Binatia bacterium]|jgi:dihydrodipicolinate synthase/N-acetylneuraminate lyase|nr:dihydrodipicolinate synthase family protein [Candidatus Binatia bacterium]